MRYRTSTPFAMSTCCVNSWGAWLMPARLGTKIMPIDRRALFPFDSRKALLGALMHAFDLSGIKIAQLVWKLDPPGNHVWRARLRSHITHRADLVAVLGSNAVAHREQLARRRRECIVAPVWHSQI